MNKDELFELEQLRALLIKGKMTAEKALRFKMLLQKYYGGLKQENDEYQELTDNLRGENAELRDKLDKLKSKYEVLEILHETYNGKYISKDIIENKIKELEKDIEVHSIYEENWNKIEVLKELLGE